MVLIAATRSAISSNRIFEGIDLSQLMNFQMGFALSRLTFAVQKVKVGSVWRGEGLVFTVLSDWLCLCVALASEPVRPCSARFHNKQIPNRTTKLLSSKTQRHSLSDANTYGIGNGENTFILYGKPNPRGLTATQPSASSFAFQRWIGI